MDGYDIFGDIHGYADQLIAALKHLGYEKRGGIYQHPARKAIFLGDIINKGPQIKEAYKIVRAMVESQQGQAVIGNHEYSLLNMFRRKGGPSEKVIFKEVSRASSTISAFENDESGFEELLQWIQTLPLFLDLGEIRLAHAAWLKKDIQFLQSHYPENVLSDRLIMATQMEYSEEADTLWRLFNGVEIDPVTGELNHPWNENRDDALRLKWWEGIDKGDLEELLVRDKEISLSKLPLSREVETIMSEYPETAPILFLGHYCLSADEAFMKPNLAILDSCVYKSGLLAVYRWSGEQELRETNLYHFKGH